MNRNCSIVAMLACVLAGCASTPGIADRDAGQAVQAGKTTFVRVPTGHGQFNVVAFAPPGTTACPGCTAIAKDYFSTGHLHRNGCDQCGAKVVIIHGQPVALQASPPPLRPVTSVESE